MWSHWTRSCHFSEKGQFLASLANRSDINPTADFIASSHASAMLLPKLPRPANDLIPTVVWFFDAFMFLFLAPFPMSCFSIEMSDVLVGIRQ